jgi:hypothetical protein
MKQDKFIISYEKKTQMHVAYFISKYTSYISQGHLYIHQGGLMKGKWSKHNGNYLFIFIHDDIQGVFDIQDFVEEIDVDSTKELMDHMGNLDCVTLVMDS